MEPQTPPDGADPPPLAPEIQAILRAYRQEHEIPDLVKARGRRRLASIDARRGEPWIRVAVVAAAVILILAALGVLPPRADRGVVQRTHDEASEAVDAATSAGARHAVLHGRSGARPGGGVAGSPDSADSADSAPTLDADSADSAGSMASVADSAADSADPADSRPRTADRGSVPGGADLRGRESAVEHGSSADRGDPEPGRADRDPAGTGGVVEASSVDDLAAERRLLEAAWRALAGGDDDGALAAIERHRREHPQGLLTQERSALEVILQCRARPGDPTHRARKDAFAAAHPRSPWRARIDAACADAPSP
ncbi:MAG: hypothetical protein R3B09_27800 [Nannocystaceae bacterium]